MSLQRNLYDKHRRTNFLPPPFLDVKYLNMFRLVSPNCTILACAASERRLSALFFTSFIDCNVHIRISILHSQPSTVIYSSESYLENSHFHASIIKAIWSKICQWRNFLAFLTTNDLEIVFWVQILWFSTIFQDQKDKS